MESMSIFLVIVLQLLNAASLSEMVGTAAVAGFPVAPSTDHEPQNRLCLVATGQANHGELDRPRSVPFAGVDLRQLKFKTGSSNQAVVIRFDRTTRLVVDPSSLVAFYPASIQVRFCCWLN